VAVLPAMANGSELHDLGIILAVFGVRFLVNGKGQGVVQLATAEWENWKIASVHWRSFARQTQKRGGTYSSIAKCLVKALFRFPRFNRERMSSGPNRIWQVQLTEAILG
jgi:hypothetical protein